jgi:multidrug efflux system membrane fusion protein
LFVWVTTTNGTVVMRPIEAGPTSGDLTVVASGVTDGDRVVTEGQLRLQQNARVAFAERPSHGAGKPP